MTATNRIALSTPTSEVTILPRDGAAAVDLTVDGLSVLARTPWSKETPGLASTATPARDEETWVRRWKGGWQLCFPTTGQPENGTVPPQSFHGAASQASWAVDSIDDARATLTWADEEGLTAVRSWELLADGLRATSIAQNRGDRPRAVMVAEHLILGGDLISRMDAAPMAVEMDDRTRMTDLDYDGRPTGTVSVWPGDPADAWDRVSDLTPARVVALTPPRDSAAKVHAGDVTATVSWVELEHVLLWEELARSTHQPWNGEVFALGIEPTTTPHGAGTSEGGALMLEPGQRLTWSTTLRIEQADHGIDQEGR